MQSRQQHHQMQQTSRLEQNVVNMQNEFHRMASPAPQGYITLPQQPQERSNSRLAMHVADVRPLQGIEATVAVGNVVGQRQTSSAQELRQQSGMLMQQGQSVQQMRASSHQGMRSSSQQQMQMRSSSQQMMRSSSAGQQMRSGSSQENVRASSRVLNLDDKRPLVGVSATFNAELPQTVMMQGQRTNSRTDFYQPIVAKSPARSESRLQFNVPDMRPLAGIEATVATGDLYGRSSSEMHAAGQRSEKFINVQDQRPFPAIEATVAVGDLMQQKQHVQQQQQQKVEEHFVAESEGGSRTTTLNLHVRRPTSAKVPVQPIKIASQDPRPKTAEPITKTVSQQQQLQQQAQRHIKGSYTLNDAVPKQHIEILAEAKEKHRQGIQIDGRAAVLIETTEVKSKTKKQNQLAEQQTSYSIYNPETKEMTQIIVEETETGKGKRQQQQQQINETFTSQQQTQEMQQINIAEVRSSVRNDNLRAQSASPGAAFYRSDSAERRTSSSNKEENMIKRRR